MSSGTDLKEGPVRRQTIRTAFTAFVAGIVFLSASAAYADNIYNTLDGSIDSTAEVMNLTLSGGNGTATLAVQETGTGQSPADGKSGCNLTGSTTLTVAVNNSAASVASVSPTSVVFTSCGSTPALTVTPLAVGSTTISLTQTQNNSGGTFTLSPATFTVNVSSPSSPPPPNTPPVLSLPASFTVAGNTTGGAIVTYTAGATDAEDDPDPIPLCAPVSGSLFPVGPTTVSCSATDSNGATTNGSFTVTVTNNPPTLNLPADITTLGNTVGGAIVTFDVSADDIEDEPDPAPSCTHESGDLFSVGTTTVECSVTDSDDATTSDSFDVTVVNNDPELTVPAGFTVEGNTTGGATVPYSGVSATDIEDDPDPTPSCAPPSGAFFSLGTTTVGCSVTDSNGGSDSGSFAITVVDTTPPALSGMPGDMTVLASGLSGAAVTYAAPTASDIVDATPTVNCAPPSGSTFAPGTTPVTCTATDDSGNSSSASFTVTVAFNVAGFFAPIDKGIHNLVKNGASVPLKFRVTGAGGVLITDTAVVSSFAATATTCPDGTATDPVETTTTGATSLRWDTTGQQFIQNWQTPKKPGACIHAAITLVGGQSISAEFKLK